MVLMAATPWHLHRNNNFVNWAQLSLLCEKSGAILLVLVGLIAGRLAVRRNTGIFSIQIALLEFTQHLTKVQC